MQKGCHRGPSTQRTAMMWRWEGSSFSTVRSLPRSNRGACQLPKGDLCKSYTPSSARSNSIATRLSMRIGSLPPMRNRPPSDWGTVSTAARWWIRGSTVRSPCAGICAVAVSARYRTPYQRGQFWGRRFQSQAERLRAALAALNAPPSAPHFSRRTSRSSCPALENIILFEYTFRKDGRRTPAVQE
jgi:hypothetical protein